MSRLVLDSEAVARALALRDLSDEQQGAHALQRIVGELLSALTRAWQCPVVVNRASPIVAVADNYDRLHYPADGAARSARYTRYVSENTLLRTQTSAAIPPLLRNVAAAPPHDVLLACPGLVYRRDTIDRAHTGEPHQIDLWRIRRGACLSETDLRDMIALVVTTVLPGCAWRCVSAEHPYTTAGLQIDVQIRDQWLEIGECGLALGEILLEAGLPDDTSGLAMGLGLDRLLMLRKGIDDIRLLRSRDPRVQAQLLDLEPYRAVSRQPAIRRDLSILVDQDDTPEELGDRVRAALGERVASVEAVEVSSETRAADLPEPAARRLKIEATQKNVLLRVVLRDLEKTLTHDEANQIRDQIYAALHRGTVYEWASGRPPPR
jgi:phenylalanyl-tRNA synthetase alpha chain